MTCPHCGGTGEVQETRLAPAATTFVEHGGLSWVPLVDPRAWLASPQAFDSKIPYIDIMRYVTGSAPRTDPREAPDWQRAQSLACIEDSATARVLAETGHLGEAP